MNFHQFRDQSSIAEKLRESVMSFEEDRGPWHDEIIETTNSGMKVMYRSDNNSYIFSNQTKGTEYVDKPYASRQLSPSSVVLSQYY